MGWSPLLCGDLYHEKYGDPLVICVVEVGAVECPPCAVTLTGEKYVSARTYFRWQTDSWRSGFLTMSNIWRLNYARVEDLPWLATAWGRISWQPPFWPAFFIIHLEISLHIHSSFSSYRLEILTHLEVWRNVKLAEHPAVVIENLLVHTVIRLYKLNILHHVASREGGAVTHRLAWYRLSEELTGDHHHAARYEQGDRPLVEQLEGEVIHWNLQIEIIIVCYSPLLVWPLRFPEWPQLPPW